MFALCERAGHVRDTHAGVAWAISHITPGTHTPRVSV